jgi:glycosyltransferase involved in cell wall biosynthesis
LKEIQVRICLYTNTAFPKRGGQELVVDALARGLIEAGEQAVVLAPRPGFFSPPDDSRSAYPVLRHPRFISTRRGVEAYGWFLRRCFKKTRFDVLHCHGVYPVGYLGALSRRSTGIPMVITDHAYPFKDGKPRDPKPSTRDRHLHALESADALVAISATIHENYLRLLPGARRIVRIPHGVATDELRRPVARPPDLGPEARPGEYALFLGRWKHQKGVDLLLRSIAMMQAGGPSLVVIAGEGPEGPALKKLSARLGLAGRAMFVGWVSGEKKAYLLQNAGCLVVPSRWAESFGLVAIESFAAGRPVVATAVPGLRELIRDGANGTLVEPESPAALSRALVEMFADPRRQEALGAAGRKVAEGHDSARVIERHVELYREIAGAASRKQAGPEGSMAAS